MSIIGIVWFPFWFLFLFASATKHDEETMVCAGFLIAAYALALSIVCLVHAGRQLKSKE